MALTLVITACSIDLPAPRQWPVTGVALNRTSLALNLWTGTNYDYRTAALTVNIFPERASQAVVWGSSDNNVARVEDGVVTAVAAGTAIITVIARDGGVMANCSVQVLNEAPGAVTGVTLDPDSLTLYLGDAAVTRSKTLTPVLEPVFVTNETVTWATSNAAVATVNQNGVVTAVAPGTADITVTADGGHTAVCTVRVTPLLAQFRSIADFLTAGNAYYKPNYDFGSDPVSKGDTLTHTSTYTGGAPNQPNFVIDYNTYNNNLFGTAGAKNLVPKFEPNSVPAGDIDADSYRSHTQFNYAAIANYAFTGYRQNHPWGINSITTNSSGGGTTRAGHTWAAGISAYAANTNTVQYSGIGVDLGEKGKYIDTVLIYAGGNIEDTFAFNSIDNNDAKCPGITLEYMPDTVAAETTFKLLYKANLFGKSTDNWNDPTANNNWPAPGYLRSPWISGGKIVPNGSSWVYVFHFEQPVLARYLRCNFEQAPVAAPATGYLGRAFVNSFEVYNTRE